MKNLSIFFTLLFSFNSYANLYLNIGLIHKKGIDKGLTLKNELHSLDEVRGKKFILLKMKSGIKFILSASYIIDAGVYGPSDAVYMEAKLFDKNGKKLNLPDDGSFIVKLGEKKIIENSEINDQLIEIRITPDIH